MLTKDNFTEEHIRNLQSESRRDPLLLERCVYAFGLLEAITRVGMPFVFKGGTSLMLLLEHPMRLSTDIDIIVRPGTDVDEYIEKASKIFPFVSCEEQKRVGKNNIEKRHFKFIYDSPINHRNIYILLDILFEEPGYAQIIEKPIKSDLIGVEDPQLQVLVPSIECILGDKLTAFAPHTIGIPLHADKDMEIIKQFYDILTLIDVAKDYSLVRDTYYRLAPNEIAYRGIDITPEDTLMDTFMTAASIASRGKIEKEDYGSYLQGIRDIRNHIYYEDFSAEIAAKKAPIIMYLATCLLKKQPFEKAIDPSKYKTMTFLNEDIKAVKEQKKINPTGYAYAIKADRILFADKEK
jgi:hypothetical protein